jgi:hypothetical protein
VIEPLVRRLPLGLREGLLGLQRSVDDDPVGAAPGQHAANRRGHPAAPGGRLELQHRLMLRPEADREEPAIPVGSDDSPAIARQVVGEVLPPGYARDGPLPPGRA